jgi:hypothetical protein
MITKTKRKTFSCNAIVLGTELPNHEQMLIFKCKVRAALEEGGRGVPAKVLHDLRIAYGDVASGAKLEDRRLWFNAGCWLSREEAAAVMQLAMPEYNVFQPQLLLKLPIGTRVMLGREGSVCCYIDRHISPRRAHASLWADDRERVGGGCYRLWWT